MLHFPMNLLTAVGLGCTGLLLISGCSQRQHSPSSSEELATDDATKVSEGEQKMVDSPVFDFSYAYSNNVGNRLTRDEEWAAIEVVSTKKMPDGNVAVVVRLILHKHVEVGGNPVGDDLFAGRETTIKVSTSDGKDFPVDVTYPTGHWHENELGLYSSYTGTVEFHLELQGVTDAAPLKCHCNVYGWNNQGSYCLGPKTLEASIVQ